MVSEHTCLIIAALFGIITCTLGVANDRGSSVSL